MDFIGEVISVETEGEVKQPARFRWRGREYRVVQVLASWQDFSMPRGLRKPLFTMRRHRNYYHVQTESGERFEMYLDRGAKRPEWVLLKDLGKPPQATTGSGAEGSPRRGEDHGGADIQNS